MSSLGPDIRALQAACSVFLDACRCSLCGLPWRKASTFPCGHTFCYDCATAALEGPGISQSECPTCKGKYWKRDLRPNPQMMTVVEHTQKLLSIAEMKVVEAAVSSSQVDKTARDNNDENRHNGCRGSIDGLSTRKPPGSGSGYAGQAHAYTGAAIPVLVVEEVKQRIADSGGPTAAGSPKRRRTMSPQNGHRAVVPREPFATLTLEAHDFARPVEPNGNVRSGSAQAMETALQPCSTKVLLRGPDSSRSQSDWPLTVHVHACSDGQRPAVTENDAAQFVQPLPDQMRLTDFVTSNIPTHGIAGERGCTSSLLQPLGPVKDRRGHLPSAVTVTEAQRVSQVLLDRGLQTQFGRRQGNALASNLSMLHLVHPLEGESATASVCCVDVAEDIRWCPRLASASIVDATRHKELTQQRNSHAAGRAATILAHRKATISSGMDGGCQLPSTVFSIRLDIPSVNNAYLDFHALLEQAVSCSNGLACSLQTAGQHVVHASHGNKEWCSWKEEDTVWLFRRLSELADPTDQEREALEFELGHVSKLLEELVMMMAELEACGSRITAAGTAADIVTKCQEAFPCPRPAYVLSAELECNVRQVEGGVGSCFTAAADRLGEIRMLDHRPDPRQRLIAEDAGAPGTVDNVGTYQLAAMFTPQQLQLQNGLQQWGQVAAESTPSSGISAGMTCCGVDISNCKNAGTLRDEVSMPWPRNCGPDIVVEGHINGGSGGDDFSNDLGDQRQYRDAGSGGSCHPLVEVAQEGTLTSDLASDTGKVARHGEHCKHPRTEVARPGIAISCAQSLGIDLPDNGLPRSAPAREAYACGSGQPIALRAAAHAHGATGAWGVESADAGAAMMYITSNMARPGVAGGRYNVLATASTLAPPALVLKPCPQRELDQGMDGVTAFPGEAGKHEMKVEDAPARARANDRVSTDDANPVSLKVPSLEPAVHGAVVRRPKPFYVLTSGLGLEGKTRVKELTRRVRGVELLNEVQPQLTHLVVNLEPERRTAVRTIKYLRAVIQGCWVVGMDWVEACLSAGRLVPEGPYEAAGDNVHMGTPAITRLLIEDGGLPLFTGLEFCLMYVKGSFDGGTKPELEALLLAAGGTLVRRPTHRAASTEVAPLTAAAALFGPAAAADLYDTSTSTEKLTQQPAERQQGPEVERSRALPGIPPVFVLVAPHTNMDVSRVIREWGCAPVQIQWVFDCISRYELLPLDSFTFRPNKITTDM